MVQFATQLTDITIQQVIVHTSYTEYYPNRTKTVENRPIGDISLTPQIKVRPFPYRVSRNSQMFNSNMCDLLYRISPEMHAKCGKQE
jgi:hypothetical protein